MKLLLAFLLSIALCASCSEENNSVNDVTVEYFREYLRKDMSYRDLVKNFGLPHKDVGSGIHIYVYTLEDSTEIWIGFTSELINARHLDKNQTLLETLI